MKTLQPYYGNSSKDYCSSKTVTLTVIIQSMLPAGNWQAFAANINCSLFTNAEWFISCCYRNLALNVRVFTKFTLSCVLGDKLLGHNCCHDCYVVPALIITQVKNVGQVVS